MRKSQITDWCHEIIRTQVKREGIYIDATMGNGYDTLLLGEMAGASGKVYAFDIQKQALDATKKRLIEHGFEGKISELELKLEAGGDFKRDLKLQSGSEAKTVVEERSRLRKQQIHLILDGHEHMDQYVEEEGADLICFNFGYLPGGDHKVCTKTSTDLQALESALRLLKKGGLLCLCIYSGGDTGFEERDAILDFLKALPAKQYTVIMNQYYNRKNNPPIPAFVWKEGS